MPKVYLQDIYRYKRDLEIGKAFVKAAYNRIKILEDNMDDTNNIDPVNDEIFSILWSLCQDLNSLEDYRDGGAN